MSVPHIAASFVAVFALMGCFLTLRVVVLRAKNDVHSGDGRVDVLARALRSHGNFVEQVPLALLGLVVAELCGVKPWLVGGLGALLVVARVLNAIGLASSLGPTTPRHAGAGMTIVVHGVSSLSTLYAVLP